jgi:hypothetical protein
MLFPQHTTIVEGLFISRSAARPLGRFPKLRCARVELPPLLPPFITRFSYTPATIERTTSERSLFTPVQ